MGFRRDRCYRMGSGRRGDVYSEGRCGRRRRRCLVRSERSQTVSSMKEKKSRQHHVWKHHMHAWATDGKVWCRQDGKTFRSSPNNLAVENEYYRLRQLDERDKKVVRWLCVDGKIPLYRELAESMLKFLDHPYALLDRIRALSPEVCAAIPMDIVEVNYVEDFFALIEEQMCPILDKMRARDLSSASCQREAPFLAFFLAAQYFRTKTMERRLMSALTPQVRSTFDCDWDRVWRVMRVILACQVGAGIHARFDLAEWIILDSPSEVELITADQPLFNTKSDIVGDDGYPQEFALYFPITPKFAVLCNLNSTAPGVRTQFMPERNARHLNERIADQAFRQVFARRRDELDLLP